MNTIESEEGFRKRDIVIVSDDLDDQLSKEIVVGVQHKKSPKALSKQRWIFLEIMVYADTYYLVV